MSRTLKLTVAYEGTAYVGWQRQAEGISIQGLLEDALSRIDGRPVVVVAAGRTDAGVHALGQIVRARIGTAHDGAMLTRALNGLLPADVRVLSVEEADATFHPRYDARSKTYQYWIWNGSILPPAVRQWCWHVARPLDVSRMDAAARLLEGRRDFAAFQSTGSEVKTSERTVRRAWVRREAGSGEAPAVLARLGAPDPQFVVFEIEADGFLRHMVRAIVGTLVEIGDGRREPESVTRLLASRDRSAAGATAPAHGLVLVGVRCTSRNCRTRRC
ncbi:MAG: tRNA pseudouridine(38-40) synthase TruA [Acidobacteriota bacterium]